MPARLVRGAVEVARAVPAAFFGIGAKRIGAVVLSDPTG
jgi:hypothetical protein